MRKRLEDLEIGKSVPHWLTHFITEPNKVDDFKQEFL